MWASVHEGRLLISWSLVWMLRSEWQSSGKAEPPSLLEKLSEVCCLREETWAQGSSHNSVSKQAGGTDCAEVKRVVSVQTRSPLLLRRKPCQFAFRYFCKNMCGYNVPIPVWNKHSYMIPKIFCLSSYVVQFNFSRKFYSCDLSSLFDYIVALDQLMLIA